MFLAVSFISPSFLWIAKDNIGGFELTILKIAEWRNIQHLFLSEIVDTTATGLGNHRADQ